MNSRAIAPPSEAMAPQYRPRAPESTEAACALTPPRASAEELSPSRNRSRE